MSGQIGKLGMKSGPEEGFMAGEKHVHPKAEIEFCRHLPGLHMTTSRNLVRCCFDNSFTCVPYTKEKVGIFPPTRAVKSDQTRDHNVA